jgi:uncharacterized protein YbjT (DUF2867 family)
MKVLVTGATGYLGDALTDHGGALVFGRRRKVT